MKLPINNNKLLLGSPIVLHLHCFSSSLAPQLIRFQRIALQSLNRRIFLLSAPQLSSPFRQTKFLNVSSQQPYECYRPTLSLSRLVRSASRATRQTHILHNNCSTVKLCASAMKINVWLAMSSSSSVSVASQCTPLLPSLQPLPLEVIATHANDLFRFFSLLQLWPPS